MFAFHSEKSRLRAMWSHFILLVWMERACAVMTRMTHKHHEHKYDTVPILVRPREMWICVCFFLIFYCLEISGCDLTHQKFSLCNSLLLTEARLGFYTGHPALFLSRSFSSSYLEQKTLTEGCIVHPHFRCHQHHP